MLFKQCKYLITTKDCSNIDLNAPDKVCTMADKITTELDLPVNSLVERGYKVIYKPKAWDDDSFYRIASCVKWQKYGHPKAARREIKKVQMEKDHLLFFLAFEPECGSCEDQDVNLEQILKKDLSKRKAARAIPTRRDLYAAAEFFQSSIHMIYWHPNGVQEEVINPPFTSYVADKIIYILSVSQENKTTYIQLTREGGAATIHTARQSQCEGLEFRRSFSHRLHETRETTTDLSEGSWEVDKSVTRHENNFLFSSLSKAMYGIQDYHWYVRELIVKCLREETLAEVFFENTGEMADEEYNTLTEKQKINEKKKKREQYISNLQKNAAAVAGMSELYAAAFIYRTRIFVQKSDMDCWEVYFPLCMPESTRQRSSYITLDKSHRLLVSGEQECNCLLREPPVEYLESISRAKLESLAIAFVLKKTEFMCCPKTARHNGHHTHLDEFCKMEKTIYERNCPSSSPEFLRKAGRTLDKVSGDCATFQQCLHKLIYGTDEVSEDFEVRKEAPDKHYLEYIARWLQKSIFIYSSWSSSWEVYNPEDSHSEEQLIKPRKKCRYYITLFYDHSADRYDIITPLAGCNCTMMPPSYDARHFDKIQFIRKEDRHNPLVEFFLDDGVSNWFSDETQNVLPTEGRLQICEAFLRPDMKYRKVDEGHDTHSLFTCLSKEIFGNEEQAARIEELVIKEILENVVTYVSLLDVKSRLKHSTTSLQQTMDKSLISFLLLFGPVPLLAAATVFQTPIYVLKVELTGENGWKSYWSSFTQLRRKKAQRTMPTIQSKCRQSGNSDSYYVTLLQDPYGNFFRIIPNRDKVCNCQLKEPDVPVEFVSFPLLLEEILSKSIASQRQFDWEVADAQITQKYRELDNALGKNQQNLRQMMELVSTQLLLYEVIISLFESRRRKINIVSIAGSSTSTLGAVLLILGIVLAPVAVGTTVGLTVAGGVISVVSSASVIGSRAVEGALTKHQLRSLIVIHDLLDILSREAAQSNDAFLELASDMASKVEGNVGELDVGELGENTIGIGLGMSPALGRLMGSFHIVPIIIARVTAQVSSMVVGSVVAGLSLAVDAAIIAYAAYNLNKGNKTSTSEIIRKNARLLRAINVKLKSYLHGNVQ